MTPAVDPALAASSVQEQELQARLREAQNARRAINSGPAPDKAQKLREACEGFEALFIQKMWEGMRASLPQDGLMHSRDEKFWQGMYDQELGKSMAKAGGIGLADMMVGQLSRNLQDAGSAAASSRSRAPMAIPPVPLLPTKPVKAAQVPAAPADIYSGEAAQPSAPNPEESNPVRSALDDLSARAAQNVQVIITRTIRATTEASNSIPHLPPDHPVVKGRSAEPAPEQAETPVTPYSAPVRTAWQPASPKRARTQQNAPATGYAPVAAPGATETVRPRNVSTRQSGNAARTEVPGQGKQANLTSGPEFASLSTGKSLPTTEPAFSRSATALLKEQFGPQSTERGNS